MPAVFDAFVFDNGLDGGFRQVADRVIACSAEPTTYAQATTLYDGTAGKFMLGSAAITSADIALSNSGAGRRATVAAKSTTAGAIGGTPVNATWVAYVDDTAQRLLVRTTANTPVQAVNAGGALNIGAAPFGFDNQA